MSERTKQIARERRHVRVYFPAAFLAGGIFTAWLEGLPL